jgi:hypothetical protein
VPGGSPATSKIQHCVGGHLSGIATGQTFPFARFGSLRLVKEALALMQRPVVRPVSYEGISRVVRRAVRLFREWVGFCHGVNKSAWLKSRDGW